MVAVVVSPFERAVELLPTQSRPRALLGLLAYGLASNEPDDVLRSIAELRTRIRVITGALEPDRNDLHLEVGRRIESARVWI